MAHVGSAPGASTSVTSAPATGFVEWGAVFAGAVLAAALSFVLLTFGTAIGLSATSPWPNSGLSARFIASVAVFWAMAQQIGSFMIGGYVAGRMRARWHGTAQDEVEFRDGLHGALVWAVGVVIGAFLFFAAAGAVARTGVDVASRTAATAAASATSPMDTVLDTMLRPATTAQASQPSPQPGTAGTAPRPRAAAAAGTTDDPRADISRMLTTAVASGSLTEENRTYLTQLVAQRTGLSQQEAEKRVNDAFTAAREAADKARKATILTGFVTAASLVLSLGAAWWAAMKGGNHRDNSVPARFDFGQRRRPIVPRS
jgi:hypothetical protein